MASNKYKIQFETIPGRPGWGRLTANFHYKGHIIPKGFEWNGASVPRWLWWLIPPWRDPVASCVHDYLCSLPGYPRKKADQAYQELMATTNNWIISGLGYAGVRVGAFFGIG